jgi:hypothetical protein
MKLRGVITAQWGWPMFALYTVLGKNLIDLFRGMAFFATAGIIAGSLKTKFGFTPFLASVALLPCLISLAWFLLLTRLLIFRPFPVCRKGKCRGIDDYYWQHGRYFGKCTWSFYLYCCRCGDYYLRRGKRFMEWLPTEESKHDIRKGITRPYLRLVGFRKWQADTAQQA